VIRPVVLLTSTPEATDEQVAAEAIRPTGR